MVGLRYKQINSFLFIPSRKYDKRVDTFVLLNCFFEHVIDFEWTSTLEISLILSTALEGGHKLFITNTWQLTWCSWRLRIPQVPSHHLYQHHQNELKQSWKIIVEKSRSNISIRLKFLMAVRWLTARHSSILLNSNIDYKSFYLWLCLVKSVLNYVIEFNADLTRLRS